MFALIFKLLFAPLAASEPMLSNIEQITFHETGFERAGEAYFAPDGEMISFQAVPSGEENYQIYTMNLKSREIKRVSQNMGACTCSFFKPDGTKLIYAGSPLQAEKPIPGTYKWDLTPYMNIYEVNIDGSDPVALTTGPAYHAECAYSPDGELIVYASDEDGSMNIYTMRSDGKEKRQLTHTADCYNGGPFFSPDGSKIVFRADREEAHMLQVYMMDKDGGNLVQLTDNGAVNWAPFWHPSGKAIAYTTSIHGHSNYEIYLLNIETGAQYRVTCHEGFDGLPTFNGEGTKLLWTSKRGKDKASHIFIADFEYTP